MEKVGFVAKAEKLMAMKSPVLLLTFNRPDTTQQVIDALRLVQPSHIFVFSDGPRSSAPDDAKKVAETRALIDREIDWPAKVEKLYSERNRGIVNGPPDAIDWFFSSVSEGVILEDDCVPHVDFLYYCDELLERYRDDHRVWVISGDNSSNLPITEPFSYGFISDPLIWGWASWRRAWEHHDRNMSDWSAYRRSREFRSLVDDRVERARRRSLFDSKPASSWAYRWCLTTLRNQGLAAVPRVNLVSNIGFDHPDAHHTFGPSPQANAETFGIFPIIHPSVVEKDPAAQFDYVERKLGVRKRRPGYRIKKWLRKRVRYLRSRLPV